LVSQLQLHNIEFREPVPLYRLAELLVMGDIHVIFQKPGTEGLLVPSKIYGVLAAGRPSLFLGPLHSEVGQIICESRSGFVVEAGDVEGTTNALATLINSAALRQEMGHNAREYYKQHFGRQRSVSKIIDIVERVAGWTVKEKDNPILGQPLQERKISRMANDRRNRGSFFAAIAASLLVFALGLSYRALSGQLFSPATGTLMGPSVLERFPVQINDWMGQDVPLDDSVPSAIGAEAYINRGYSRGNRLESVSLFVAASGTRRDALVGHPPELCNVMAGWTLMNCSSTELPLGGETKLPCSIFEFSQNGLLDPTTWQTGSIAAAVSRYDQECGDVPTRSTMLPKCRLPPPGIC
jgi:hypothetical protein